MFCLLYSKPVSGGAEGSDVGVEWGGVGEKGGGGGGGVIALEEDGEGGEYVSACDAAAEMSREQVRSLFALLVQKYLLTGTQVPILTLLALSLSRRACGCCSAPTRCCRWTTAF
jgi:hypothetical protein